MKTEAAILVVGGIAMILAYQAYGSKPIGRLVLTWRRNTDGTCTFTYDDGSQETEVCTTPPA